MTNARKEIQLRLCILIRYYTFNVFRPIIYKIIHPTNAKISLYGQYPWLSAEMYNKCYHCFNEKPQTLTCNIALVLLATSFSKSSAAAAWSASSATLSSSCRSQLSSCVAFLRTCHQIIEYSTLYIYFLIFRQTVTV